MGNTYRPGDHPRNRDGKFARKQPPAEPGTVKLGFGDDNPPTSMLDAVFTLAGRSRDSIASEPGDDLNRWMLAEAVRNLAAMTAEGQARFDYDDLNPQANAWLAEYQDLCHERSVGRDPFDSDWDDTIERGLALLDAYLGRRTLSKADKPVRCRLCRVLVPASHRTDRDGRPVCDNCHDRRTPPGVCVCAHRISNPDHVPEHGDTGENGRWIVQNPVWPDWNPACPLHGHLSKAATA